MGDPGLCTGCLGDMDLALGLKGLTAVICSAYYNVSNGHLQPDVAACESIKLCVQHGQERTNSGSFAIDVGMRCSTAFH